MTLNKINRWRKELFQVFHRPGKHALGGLGVFRGVEYSPLVEFMKRLKPLGRVRFDTPGFQLTQFVEQGGAIAHGVGSSAFPIGATVDIRSHTLRAARPPAMHR